MGLSCLYKCLQNKSVISQVGMGALVSQMIHKKGQTQYTDKCSIPTKKKPRLNPDLTRACSTNSLLFIKVKLETDEIAGYII